MKKKASATATIMAFLGLLMSGCGTPAPESTSAPPSPTAMPTLLPATPTPTAERIEPDFASASLGLSMWYPEGWTYEEDEQKVTFATSQQVISREEYDTGALMVIRPSWIWGWSLERWFEDALAAWAYDSYLGYEIGDPGPQTIGGKEGLMVPFEASAFEEVEARGFAAAAESDGWGYFIVGSALDDSPQHEAHLKAMLDSVQFTSRTSPVPTPLETNVPTYTRPDAGLSMWYPEEWVYEEYEGTAVFATSQERMSGDEPGTGATMVVWWGAYWVGEPYQLQGQPAHFLVWSTSLFILDSGEVHVENLVDQQPRIIGGKDGVMGVVLIFEGTAGETALPVRFFVAGAEHEGYGYTFYGLAPLEEWRDQWPHFEAILDNVEFTTPPTPTPTPIPTATPTVPSGPIATPQALAGTPIPRTEVAISPGNADLVAALSRWDRRRGFSVAFSPDGQILASGYADGTLVLWRVGDGKLVNSLEGHEDAVLSVSFSPDGQTLASGSRDGAVRLWRVADGTPVHTLEGHAGSVLRVAYSPGGQVLASASQDHTVRLWQASDGMLLRSLERHSNVVSSVAFSPDGQTLASGSTDQTVCLWHVSDGALLRTLEGHTSFVSSVAFSPDGRVLASGSWDKSVRLWQVSDGALLATLEGHTDLVNSLAFSPDGRVLASASDDHTVRLWQVSDGTPLRSLAGHADSVASVAFQPTGHTLASQAYDGTILLWGIPAQ